MKKHLTKFKERHGFIGILIACVVVIILIILVFIGSAAIIGDRTGLGNNSGLITSDSGGCTDGKLSQSQLVLINQNKSVYQQAAQAEGIDWEMLAAIHFRESDNNPGRSLMSGELLGTRNPDNGLVYNTLYDSAVAAAKSLKSRVSGLHAGSDADTIKKAFLGHNRGNMYSNGGCNIDQSPYVMNQYDTQHTNMTWPNSSCEPASTRGRTETRPGAFTVYSILKGNIAGSSSCSASTGAASGVGCNNVPLFKQCNGSWGSNSYGCGSTTICSSGCGLNAAAMVLNFYKKNVDPNIMANLSLANGYRACGAGTSYGLFPFVAKKYGLKVENGISWDRAMTLLKQGTPIVAAGKGAQPFTSGGHFIVLTCYNSNGTISVNDSAGSAGGPRDGRSYPASMIQAEQHFLSAIHQ